MTRLRGLAAARRDFAFETTMASRTFAPWLRGLEREGYTIHMVFLWLRSPQLAARRVRTRVRQGGHSVPENVIRRRYARGILNFVTLYRPLAQAWRVYDNSAVGAPRLVASGTRGATVRVYDHDVLRRIEEVADGQQGKAEEHF